MKGKRIAIVLLLIIAIAASVVVAVRHYPKPVIDFQSGQAGPAVVVEIPDGSTGADVAHILARAGVVKSWQAFFNRAATDSNSVRIQPGSHRIATHLSAKEALDQLLDRKRMVGLITVTEGMRAADLLKLLSKSGWPISESTAAFAETKAPVGYQAPTSEGYLFPASYSFARGTSATSVFQAMVSRFVREAAAIDIAGGAKTLSLTPSQIVTIASLVQAEGDPQDFDKIARVILNRLADGMMLQLDTTVLYALNAAGRIRVTNADLRVASKYNTYQHAGLPPGPIGNPGNLALNAALHPATGPWLYFITVKPGDTRFTASESEFLSWKREYERNYATGAFNVPKSKP